MAMLKSRIEELDRRVRESELFPRIRDAEKAMAENEMRFVKRQLKRKKDRSARAAAIESCGLIDTKTGKLNANANINRATHTGVSSLPPVKSSDEKVDYFSRHVLNKDPSASAYMPFDEVFFPRLYHSDTSAATDVSSPPPPHSIDQLWWMAMQHEATRSKIMSHEKTKAEFK